MAFHRAIIDGAGSERLARAYDSVQSEILLCMAQLRPHYDKPSQVARVHRELLGAARHVDLRLAEKRFRAHLDKATENSTDALEGARGGGRWASRRHPPPASAVA